MTGILALGLCIGLATAAAYLLFAARTWSGRGTARVVGATLTVLALPLATLLLPTTTPALALGAAAVALSFTPRATLWFRRSRVATPEPALPTAPTHG